MYAAVCITITPSPAGFEVFIHLALNQFSWIVVTKSVIQISFSKVSEDKLQCTTVVDKVTQFITIHVPVEHSLLSLNSIQSKTSIETIMLQELYLAQISKSLKLILLGYVVVFSFRNSICPYGRGHKRSWKTERCTTNYKGKLNTAEFELTLIGSNNEELCMEFILFDEVHKVTQFNGISFYSFLCSTASTK